jgi:hypothetical protein
VLTNRRRYPFGAVLTEPGFAGVVPGQPEPDRGREGIRWPSPERCKSELRGGRDSGTFRMAERG